MVSPSRGSTSTNLHGAAEEVLSFAPIERDRISAQRELGTVEAVHYYAYYVLLSAAPAPAKPKDRAIRKLASTVLQQCVAQRSVLGEVRRACLTQLGGVAVGNVANGPSEAGKESA